MSQLKLGMGCTLDEAAPDNKAVERVHERGSEREKREKAWTRQMGRQGEAWADDKKKKELAIEDRERKNNR